MLRNKPKKLWGFYHGTSVGAGSRRRPLAKLASWLNKPLVMGVGRGKKFGEKDENSGGLKTSTTEQRTEHGQRWKLLNTFFL